MDSAGSSIDQLFREDIAPRDLPPCDLEHLDELLLLLKTSHPTVRSKVQADLVAKDGAYVVKLLDLFDVSELDEDKSVLHKLFDVFYAILEMCNRSLIEVLLSDTNFISVVGVFGYNPGLIREMDFRTELEGDGGFHEVVPITEESVLRRVHMNFRIQVIKDNVLSRTLPDGCVLLLEHMANENNYHILSYISETEDYWKAIYGLISSKDKRLDGLGLLKAIINLIRVTKPIDRPSQRRDPFGSPPVFGSLIGNLFGAELFAAFATVLGSPDSTSEEVALAVDILNVLVFYQGPDKLRAYLASEGKCIPAPTSDKDRITWTSDSSLFTTLLIVFERDEPLRIQLFNLLREVFRVPLGHDDKFLSVLYPNYMHWLLQPLKNSKFVHDESAMFDLQDSIMELLTFCTENHGYRVKYLFGRQPIATYAEKMLRSKHKLFVIHAVKFVRACAVRAEAFFSRFLIQNDLFTPMLANLEVGQANSGAVSSAILEALAFIEKTNLTSLVEHVYTKFYETYKTVCPLVFEAIRTRYDGNSGSADASMDSADTPNKVRFARAGSIDNEEELYWEKDTDTNEPTPQLEKNGLSEEEVPCQNHPRSVKLVDYDDDEDESTTSQKEESDAGSTATISPRNTDVSSEEEHELKLPVRKKKDDDVDTQSFLGGSNLLAQKKAHQKHSSKARSPQFKNVFQKISWKLTTPESSNGNESSTATKAQEKHDESDGKHDDSNSNSVGNGSGDDGGDTSAESTALIAAKRKLALDEGANPESLLKKAKTCTPISSS